MQMSKQAIAAFQKEILAWYAAQKRDLPWRGTDDPYKILISEVMSQQTQIQRVIPKYEAWLKEFPTIQDLAKASVADVLRMWSGLGYNRRALYLQKLAKTLMDEIPDQVRDDNDSGQARMTTVEIASYPAAPAPRNDKVVYPHTIEGWKALPGIGEYTARAVLCFAFGAQIAVVDTNVRKVILTKAAKEPDEPKGPEGTKDLDSRLRGNDKDSGYPKGTSHIRDGAARMTEKEIQERADQLLPAGQAREWNQALMDYAAAMLKKEKIPMVKQSKFKGSDRYYRGQIIKMLLEKRSLDQASSFAKASHVAEALRDKSEGHSGMTQYELLEQLKLEKERLEKIMKKMEKDGLIVVKENTVLLG